MKSTVIRNVIMRSALIVWILAAIAVLQPTHALAATSLSGINWPVDGSVGTWSIENGYYWYDHGCLIDGVTNLICPPNGRGIAAQLYGFDLVLNNSSFATDNQHVYSPVNGTISYAVTGSYPGYALGILVDNTSNLSVSLVHLTNLQLSSGSHVIVGQYLGDIIQQDAANNTHLHFNLFRTVGGVRIPVPFITDSSNLYGGYDTHIIGCSQSQYTPLGLLNWANKTYTSPTGNINDIENQYGGGVIGCGFQSETINFSVSMTGISTRSGDNNSPRHPTRTATVKVLDANNNVVETFSPSVTYSTSTGVYSGSVTTGVLNPGSYLVSVKLSNTLAKQFPGFFTIPGGVKNEQTLPLVSGDINGDNVIDILDYNDLLSCYGSKFPSCAFNPSADLNDDGVVDAVDYNIFLRAIGSQGS